MTLREPSLASLSSITFISLVWIWLQPNSWALDSATSSCRWCLGILPCAAPINAIQLQWWLWQWQGKALQFCVEWFTVQIKYYCSLITISICFLKYLCQCVLVVSMHALCFFCLKVILPVMGTIHMHHNI